MGRGRKEGSVKLSGKLDPKMRGRGKVGKPTGLPEPRKGEECRGLTGGEGWTLGPLWVLAWMR